MNWEDSPPRKGIAFGAALGLSATPALFQVSILRVPDGEPVPAALAEFWRRVLTDGPPRCARPWDVLAVEYWPNSGGFTAVFTQSNLSGDQLPVFKFRSGEMDRLWHELPETDDPGFDAAADTLDRRWVGLIGDALRTPPASDLLAALRRTHPTPVWLTNQTRHLRRVLGV